MKYSTCPLGRCAALFAATAILLATATGEAAPVTQAQAEAAAIDVLPIYYPGSWKLQKTYPMVDLEGTRAAFAVVFRKTGEKTATESCEAALAKALQSSKRNASMRHHDPVLTAEDQFATLYMAADDTEPVLLRGQKGLPTQLIAQHFALQQAQKEHPEQNWTSGRLLFVGMFDELAEVVPQTTDKQVGEALIVDLRRGLTNLLSEARAELKQKLPTDRDPNTAKRCQEAWKRYQKLQPMSAIPIDHQVQLQTLSPAKSSRVPSPASEKGDQ